MKTIILFYGKILTVLKLPKQSCNLLVFFYNTSLLLRKICSVFFWVLFNLSINVLMKFKVTAYSLNKD